MNPRHVGLSDGSGPDALLASRSRFPKPTAQGRGTGAFARAPLAHEHHPRANSGLPEAIGRTSPKREAALACVAPCQHQE